jgi:hypothetical protein
MKQINAAFNNIFQLYKEFIGVRLSFKSSIEHHRPLQLA